LPESPEQAAVNQPECLLSVRSLLEILDPERDLPAALNSVVQEAHRVTLSDHVFLFQYEPAGKHFRPLAWKSPVTPGIVPLDKKLMAEMYLANRRVVLDDLTRYSYRLRPEAARQGLLSLAGIPIMGGKGLLGIIECLSREASHFTPAMIDNLLILAGQTALIMEKAEQEAISKRLGIENAFLHEIAKAETHSAGMLLYGFGEALFSLLDVDGIAVFGLDAGSEDNILQEVMAKGFSMPDIGRLKKSLDKEFLQKAARFSAGGGKPPFLKRLLRDKLLYIIPVTWQDKLYGVVVCYQARPAPDNGLAGLEQFISRIVESMGLALQRNSMYSGMQRLSLMDSLTQLANRRLFDYILGRELNKIRRHSSPLSLLLIDIDHFKKINDQYGHQVGDLILTQVAKLLQHDFRSVDLPARYGGEEFAVIMPNTALDSALAAAERFRKRVENTPLAAGSQHVNLTVSIGVATHSGAKKGSFFDPAAILRASDEALYKAKQQGRNQVVASNI